MKKPYTLGGGFNWFQVTAPYLVETSTNSVAVISGANKALYFDKSGTSWAIRFNRKELLTRITFGAADYYALSLPDGSNQIYAIGDAYCPIVIDIKGQSITSYDYTPSQQVSAVTRTFQDDLGNLSMDRIAYSYTGDNITSITHQRQINNGGWENIRQATYDFYNSLSSHGSDGDLKTVTRNAWNGSAWIEIDTSYYRYYKSGDTNGFEHGLKYSFGPQAYDALVADIPDPDSSPDIDVAAYADFYFEYDSDQRVVLEKVQGATCGQASQGQYLFEYVTSGNDDGDNSWKTKTTETRPDGSKNVVYTNYAGRVMLSELRDSAGTNKYRKYYKYDDYLLIQQAEPSAIISFDDTHADLAIVLQSTSGLIRQYEYYSTTGSGAAAGYLKKESLLNGSTGTPILQRFVDYISNTFSGITTFYIAHETRYRDDAGTQPITTGISYSFDPTYGNIVQRITTLPSVSSSQNGSGVSATIKEQFDGFGNQTWLQNERNVITQYVYDVPTGALVQQVDDFNTAVHAGVAPTGWTTPSATGFGLHLVTDYESDALGRITQTLGPSHSISLDGSTTTIIRTASWNVYKDTAHQTYQGQGYATGSSPSYSFTLVNPVSISNLDYAGRVVDQIDAVRFDTSGALTAADSFTDRSLWRTWAHARYGDDDGDSCQLGEQRVYYDIPSMGEGSKGTNYDVTTYSYDSLNRQNKSVGPGGTISRRVYDIRGLVLSEWIGTNDAGATDSNPAGLGAPNNMKKVSEATYDISGNISVETKYITNSTVRTTNKYYDFRNRITNISGELGYYQVNFYNNLDQVIQLNRDFLDTSVVPNTVTLIGQSNFYYDDRNRLFKEIIYAVNSSGVAGNGLASLKWYDEGANVIKDWPAGSKAYSRSVYDGMNRLIGRYFGFDLSSTGLGTLADDTVIEQSEMQFDDDSNLVMTVSKLRRENASSSTGPLSNMTTAPEAIVYYTCQWPDSIGRVFGTADYGTNNDTSLSYPSIPPALPSNDIIIELTGFDDAGRVSYTVNNRLSLDGIIYDDASREVQVIKNVFGSGPDASITTLTTYTADGNIDTLTAVNPTTGNQETSYTYGSDATSTSVATTFRLKEEFFPDSGSSTDRVLHTYNYQGEEDERTDQIGNVRAFEYDGRGRRIADRVKTLISPTDGTVRRIETTYNVRGLVEHITSYDSDLGGNVVNDVLQVYNDFNQLMISYQEHNGTVATSTAPKVQYDYADGSANTVRLESITYPNGRQIDYNYGTANSIDDILSRVKTINESSTAYIEYSYVGSAVVVEGSRSVPELRYSLVGGSGYSGLNRWGWVVNPKWYNDSGSPVVVDELKYGYVPAGDRVWRENVSDPTDSYDWVYTYDTVGRLVDGQRGKIKSDHSGIDVLKFAQDWTLDKTANWSEFKQDNDGNGTWDLDQDRDSNVANEITGISGGSWIVPAYDANGNVTTLPIPGGPTLPLSGVYDAWNRMVGNATAASPGVVVNYAYDGLNRRTKRIISLSTTPPVTTEVRHFYYSKQWQVVEERVGSGSPESLAPDRQFLWGLQYVDELVLRWRHVTTGLDEILYALQDANWNVTALYGLSGATWGIRQRYEYDPYGIPSILTPVFVSSSDAYAWETTYAGYRLDVLGFYLVRNRYYHPTLGLWLSRDPIGYTGDLNLYAYCESTPINSTDPNGTLTAKPKKKIKKGDDCEELLEATWVFSVDNKKKCAGFIIQKVEVFCNLSNDCNDCRTTTPKDASFVYYEAWEVDNRGHIYPKSGKWHDRGKFELPGPGCGKYKQVRTLKFFCVNDDNRNIPKDWKRDTPNGYGISVNRGCITTAGSLLAIEETPENKPLWFDSPPDEGPIPLSFSVDYCCCEGKKPYYMRRSASP